jgi:hypothetical protein
MAGASYEGKNPNSKFQIPNQTAEIFYLAMRK